MAWLTCESQARTKAGQLEGRWNWGRRRDGTNVLLRSGIESRGLEREEEMEQQRHSDDRSAETLRCRGDGEVERVQGSS